MNNSLIYLLNLFTKKNNIQLDKEETKIQLLSHPYFPSINSITDLFSHFKIDNLALKVTPDNDTFSQLPNTFLAQIQENSINILVVMSKKKGSVELTYDKNKIKLISIEDFLKIWTGIVIVIEKADTKITLQKSVVSNLKTTIALISLAVLVFIFLFANPTIFQLIHFVLSGIGVYISYLIVQHELGLHSKILDKFCSGNSKKTNCDAVLSSKGATVFKLFKLSDVGLVYFVSLALTWILIALNKWQSTSVIFLISSLAIPFTFFSIYYQWKIVKNWCPLCLTVVGILWLQFGSLFLNQNALTNMVGINASYLLLAISILIVISLWSFTQPLLKKKQEFQKLEIEHIKFKRNFTLFKAALNLNETINTTTEGINELVFGNKLENAPLKLTIITNPMCGFCKESHAIVEEILQQENSAIQITIRFNVQADNKEAIGTKISARIIELFHTASEKECLQALSNIYGDMKADAWLSKWGETSTDEYFTILKNEKEWCTANKINFTPAILLNGQQYPKEYDRKDVLFFLDDLIEEQVEISCMETEMVNK